MRYKRKRFQSSYIHKYLSMKRTWDGGIAFGLMVCKLKTTGDYGDQQHRNHLYRNSWWRHRMETFSALLALFAGNSPVTGEFPSQRPFFLICAFIKRLSDQPSGWWFDTPSWHRNVHSLWYNQWTQSRHPSATTQPTQYPRFLFYSQSGKTLYHQDSKPRN